MMSRSGSNELTLIVNFNNGIVYFITKYVDKKYFHDKRD